MKREVYYVFFKQHLNGPFFYRLTISLPSGIANAIKKYNICNSKLKK